MNRKSTHMSGQTFHLLHDITRGPESLKQKMCEWQTQHSGPLQVCKRSKYSQIWRSSRLYLFCALFNPFYPLFLLLLLIDNFPHCHSSIIFPSVSLAPIDHHHHQHQHHLHHSFHSVQQYAMSSYYYAAWGYSSSGGGYAYDDYVDYVDTGAQQRAQFNAGRAIGQVEGYREGRAVGKSSPPPTSPLNADRDQD